MSNKITEALKHVAKGDKALSTGLFKWSPDYDVAAEEFNQAALKFQLGKSHEKAIFYYMKAADMCAKTGSTFRSAKLLCQAGQIKVELKQLEEGVNLMEQAARLYREQGSTDTAVLTYVKAAKLLEQEFPNRARDLFLTAAELCEVDEKIRDACDHLNGAIRVVLKQKKYLKACSFMKDRLVLLKSIENWSLAHQMILGMVIAYLGEGDFNAAEEANINGFSVHGYSESDYAMCAEKFLQAFKDGDEEILSSVKKQPLVKHMEVELAKLAKSLTIENVTSSADKSGISELEQFERTEALKANTSTAQEDIEPPDEDGGLC